MTMNGCNNREHERYMPCRKCQARKASLQGIVSASIVAYKEGRAWNPYHPGYTDHERMAWEIGQAEVEKVKRA